MEPLCTPLDELSRTITNNMSTVLVLRLAHRKWKETKQQPSMLPGPAVPGSCLVSFHILWAILNTSTVQCFVNGSFQTTPYYTQYVL